MRLLRCPPPCRPRTCACRESRPRLWPAGLLFGRPAVMITDHVSAVRVPPDNAGRRGVAAVAARGDVEDRGNLDPAPPAQRAAAAAAAAAEAELGGPGPARYPARRHTESAAPGTAAAGYPGHDRALAPRHRPPPLGRQVRVREDRAASDPAQYPGTGPTAGSRESQLGVPQDPWRARRPGG